MGAMPSSANMAGINVASAQSTYLTADTAWDGTDTLTYTLGGLGATDAIGTITFQGTGTNNGVSWDCTGGDFPDKYRPANCRT